MDVVKKTHDIEKVSIEAVQVQLFGNFRITVGEHSIGDTDTRTKQLWLLLQYLITFRDKTLSQEEIIKVMWPENDIKNPANALKNLVYRIRTTLKEWEIPYASEMIVYNRGSYQWNNKLPCIIDVEEFERCCEEGKNAAQGKDYQIEKYRQAIDLYKGDYLPSNSDESWVIPISSYLHTLFLKTVTAMLEILQELDEPTADEEIVRICQKALVVDPLEEGIHRYLIKAYHKLGYQREAVEHFQFMTRQFYKELGTGPSEEMQEIYRSISKTTNKELNMEMLRQDLQEVGRAEGAFYCEYEVFKNLYRIEVRTAARTGKSIFICMLTIECAADKDFELSVLAKSMDILKDTMQGNLRKGDVFSRFSPRQYALLLATGNYENAEMVISRIILNYRRTLRNPAILVHGKIVPLEPTS